MTSLAGLVTAAVVLAVMPLVRLAMMKHGVVDVPNHRSSHCVIIPRGGGTACALGIVTGSVAAALAHHHVPWAALGASLALAAVGFLDDRFHLPALPRLGAQVLVGAALGATLGGSLWIGLGALVVPVVVNVVNFMDGINGITALTMALWGLTALIAGASHLSSGLALLGALTAGAALGFLPWNAPRARIFLGDVGSYLFGVLTAAGILVGSADGVSPLVLMAPLSVYLLDAGSTLLVRMVRRAPLMMAHRDHIYQRTVSQLGLPHLLVAGWSVAIAAVVTLSWSAAPLALAVVLSAVSAGVYLGSIPILRGALRLAPAAREGRAS